MSSNLIVPSLLCFDRPDQKIYVSTASIEGKICSSVFGPSVYVSTNSTQTVLFSDIEKMCLTVFDSSVLYFGQPGPNSIFPLTQPAEATTYSTVLSQGCSVWTNSTEAGYVSVDSIEKNCVRLCSIQTHMFQSSRLKLAHFRPTDKKKKHV